MTDLDRVLGDIHVIRRQVAQNTRFRGYGPATLAGTGLLALLAGATQARLAPAPATHIAPYLTLWIATAVLSAALIGLEMRARTRRIHTGLADEMIRLAVEQFLPAAATGALVTFTLARFAPAALWLLPGLWQIIYALGIFSSCRFLPRPMLVAAAWYLLMGLTAIALGDTRALSPWVMAIPFAAGQALIAAILLYYRAEESDAL